MTAEQIVDRVIGAACARFDTKPEKLRGPLRNKHATRARHVAMYVARQKGLSYPAIGAGFGRRHHTTVMSACARVDNLIALGVGSVADDVRAVLATVRDLETT